MMSLETSLNWCHKATHLIMPCDKADFTFHSLSPPLSLSPLLPPSPSLPLSSGYMFILAPFLHYHFLRLRYCSRRNPSVRWGGKGGRKDGGGGRGGRGQCKGEAKVSESNVIVYSLVPFFVLIHRRGKAAKNREGLGTSIMDVCVGGGRGGGHLQTRVQ